MSKRTIAYNNFKQALFQGTLHPGQFVTQKELCEILDVSISPLRDAIKELESENIIEVLPKTGLRIARIDQAFIKEAFQMRMFLESGAIRWVASEGDLGFLIPLREETQKILDQSEEEINAELLETAHVVDLKMHSEIIAALNNNIVSESHRLISERVRLIRLNNRYIAPRLKSALTEHLSIMDACLDRNPDLAQRELEKHLKISEARALGLDDQARVLVEEY